MFLSVRPEFNAHLVTPDDDGTVLTVEDMRHSDVRINGGFFVFRREIFDLIEPGDELVEEPFARLIARARARRVPVRRLLRPDGHDQGSAAPRGAATSRAARRGARSASTTSPIEPRPADAAAEPVGGASRSAACSRSAATPTTSRSAAAGRCSRSTRTIPELEVDWVVLAAPGERGEEARASAAAFLAAAGAARVEVHGFRDGFLPYLGGEVKELFEELKARVDPQLIFTHTGDDLHQDHRLACELTWNTFRNHLILEYEIPKFDGDLGTAERLRTAERRRSRTRSSRCSSSTSRARRASTGSTARRSSG